MKKEKSMRKLLQKAGLFLLTVCLAFGCFTGCADPDAELKAAAKYMLNAWMSYGPSGDDAIKSVVDEFNRTNTDGIYVTTTPLADPSGIGMNLAGSAPPDVVYTDDRYFKGYVDEDYLTDLGEYVEKSELVDLDDFWSSTVERFKYDPDTGITGGDSPMYALPFNNDPTVIYYNKTVFKGQGINIVSIDESELDRYNAANGTNYLPHGYYEYAADPSADASLVKTGEVYRVFNDRIPMNWQELRQVSTIAMQGEPDYGFLNEWWFSYGWSVGGDCLEWVEDPNGDGNTSDAQYMFSLGEKTSNYLVTKAEKVNGHAYAAGDILSYDDKHYVEKNKNSDTVAPLLAGDQPTLYPLPSIYQAFTEFCRLSQKTTQAVTIADSGLFGNGINGYGISPPSGDATRVGKSRYFTSQKVAMLCMPVTSSHSISAAIGNRFEWDVCPLYQWREYNNDGTLKKLNGTPVVGKKAAHNAINGYAIPAHSSQKDAAWKFIEYMTSVDVQKKMTKSYTGVPVRKSAASSEAYAGWNDRFVPANKAAILEACEYCTVGDWSYVEDGEWISPWSTYLNDKVRNGDKTLDDFFADACIGQTNRNLKKYTAKKFNG